MPPPPPPPSTPEAACLALYWLQLVVVALAFPLSVAYILERRSRCRLLCSRVRSDVQGMAAAARREAVRFLPRSALRRAHSEPAGGTPSWRSKLRKASGQALQSVETVLPYTAATLLSWQACSVVWLACVAAAEWQSHTLADAP